MRGCAVLMGWIHRSRVTRTGFKFLGVLRLCPGLGCVRGGRTKVRRGERLRVLPPLPQRCGWSSLRRWRGHPCPGVQSLPILHSSFPFSSHLSPHTHLFVFQAASSALFSSISIALPLLPVSLQACLFRSSFFVLAGPGGSLHFFWYC